MFGSGFFGAIEAPERVLVLIDRWQQPARTATGDDPKSDQGLAGL